MKLKWKVEGGAKLAKSFRAMGESASRRAMVGILMDAGEPIRDLAASYAPVAPGAPDLADNIVIAPVRSETSTDVNVAIGPEKKFYYGGFLEFGTTDIAARPWLRPAFEQGARAVLDKVVTAVWHTVILRKGGYMSRPSIGEGE